MDTPLKHSRLYWLHALTPVHVGVGRGLDYIDLPIMREKITHWPIVPSSAVKGVLRAHYEETENSLVDVAFGSGGDSDANAGSLNFTDAHIVCLPVRSLYGTFAWCTSPMALRRFLRDITTYGGDGAGLEIPAVANASASITSSDTALAERNTVFLEDLDFNNTASEQAKNWALYIARSVFGESSWQEAFVSRFIILSDDTFNFLCDTGTEVNARIRIEQETKTVVPGALWYEESLPAETLLAGGVWCERLYKGRAGSTTADELFSQYCCKPLHLQIGGNATTGQGQVRCIFDSEAAKP
ncbi:type III-B CRISPR module RAMP protein Cmr4 [Teredinibacter turnerae]|uniref:type III-B CRISPR module RAMP protein Cmr4 n=1 Tax=Teredinibacter turnerae TaxID=2426 RepID=UPI000360E83C|nr:type III-B CRISPR module RAMP protein Cmr4 [Teredinibacter turnerae]